MNIDNIIENFENWLDDQAKNSKWYFKIYLVKSNDVNPSKANLVYINTKSEDKYQSMEMLRKALELLCVNGKEYVVIQHIASKTDGTGLDLYFKNPMYKKNNYSSSISGVDNMQYLSIQEKHFREIQDLKDEINQIKQDHKITELENRISGILEEKKTTLDFIQGFLESNTGQQLVKGITQIINTKLSLKSQQPINQLPEPVQNEIVSPEPKQDTDQTQIINESMANLQNVFGQDVIENLYHLSNWVNKNPELATSLIGQIKNTENGTI